uniref:Uncharacterized protein n=1 Tax=Cacopsylla melanoneura TaxID=428564 RepID=A0A8D9AU00_9HEMI
MEKEIATTTKICPSGGSRRPYDSVPSAHTTASSYSSGLTGAADANGTLQPPLPLTAKHRNDASAASIHMVSSCKQHVYSNQGLLCYRNIMVVLRNGLHVNLGWNIK